MHHEFRRQVVIDHIAWQRPADLPAFRLARRHAAVVLFGEARRAMTTVAAIGVIVAHGHAIVVVEFTVDVDRGGRLAAAVAVLALATIVMAMAFARPRLGTNRQRPAESTDTRRVEKEGV